MELELRGKKKNIIGYTKVSIEHYDHLKKFKFNKGQDGYVKSTIKGKPWRLHRYIFQEIMNIDINEKIIDHINNDRLNNRKFTNCNIFRK